MALAKYVIRNEEVVEVKLKDVRISENEINPRKHKSKIKNWRKRIRSHINTET